jgi:hypothetical protein
MVIMRENKDHNSYNNNNNNNNNTRVLFEARGFKMLH